MFSRVRIAIRFFFMGLAVGVLLAPRSGKETRRMVRERADRLLNDLLDAATLGAFDSGAGPDEDGGTGSTDGGNGRSRKATGAATSGAQA
jgi:hypothetical protein